MTEKDGVLEFLVNDRDYENNTVTFTVNVNIKRK